MIAVIFNAGWWELLIVALIAVMVFGRDLPQVAAKAFIQLQKLRRGVQQVWRETGISEEMRKLSRQMEENERKLRSPLESARRIQADLREQVEGESASTRKATSPIGEPVPGTVAVDRREGPREVSEEPDEPVEPPDTESDEPSESPEREGDAR